MEIWRTDAKRTTAKPPTDHPQTVRNRRDLPVRDCDGDRFGGVFPNLCDPTDNPHAKNRFVSLPNRTDLHNDGGQFWTLTSILLQYNMRAASAIVHGCPMEAR